MLYRGCYQSQARRFGELLLTRIESRELFELEFDTKMYHIESVDIQKSNGCPMMDWTDPRADTVRRICY